jgi:hypothetical protein
MHTGMRAWSLLAGAALSWSAAAPAAPGCWSEAAIDAAKVRDLQSRLMVATLRCQSAGFDITSAYNRFVVANRATLQGVNGVLMTVFQSGSGDDAQGDYDRYATALANAYGGDATNRSVCLNAQRLADDAAAAGGDVARLVALHSRVGAAPPRPGGACTAPPTLEPRPAGLSRAAERAPAADERPLGWLILDEPETDRRR